MLFLSLSCFAQTNSDGNIFRDKNGESINIQDLVNCNYKQPTPDGSKMTLAPSDQGNLVQVFVEGPNAGKSTNYKFTGESDSKIYRVYRNGSVIAAVHQTKPLVIMIYDGEQFVGTCAKVIPDKTTQVHRSRRVPEIRSCLTSEIALAMIEKTDWGKNVEENYDAGKRIGYIIAEHYQNAIWDLDDPETEGVAIVNYALENFQSRIKFMDKIQLSKSVADCRTRFLK